MIDILGQREYLKASSLEDGLPAKDPELNVLNTAASRIGHLKEGLMDIFPDVVVDTLLGIGDIISPVGNSRYDDGRILYLVRPAGTRVEVIRGTYDGHRFRPEQVGHGPTPTLAMLKLISGIVSGMDSVYS